MRRDEQWTKEQYKSVRTNILWCVLYAVALLVVYFDVFVWRVG
jgi:hypothetical protein